MRLVLRISLILLALIIGFVPVVLDQESRATHAMTHNQVLTMVAEALDVERRQVDVRAQALTAVKLELEMVKAQKLALEQEHQRAVSLTAKLAQELENTRHELTSAKQQRSQNSTTPSATLN